MKRNKEALLLHSNISNSFYMVKEIFSNKKKEISLDEIKETLGQKNACYVLLTCSCPTEEGKMTVEVCYEGEESLASYLLDNAQDVLANNMKRSEDSC